MGAWPFALNIKKNNIALMAEVFPQFQLPLHRNAEQSGWESYLLSSKMD